MIYEDYSIDTNTDDIYFDSKGDIQVNYLNVDSDTRYEQVLKDVYHLIFVYQSDILKLDTEVERRIYIKNLFVNDNRNIDFNISFDGNDIIIEDLTYE